MDITKITKLNATNYHTWNPAVENYLASKKLVKYITYETHAAWFATIPKSTQQTAYDTKVLAITNSVKSAEEEVADREQLDTRFHNDLSLWSSNEAKSLLTWGEDNEQCMALIRSSTDKSFHSTIKLCVSAKDMWVLLKTETKTLEVGSTICQHIKTK
jgi:hypothetical protein